MLGAVRTFLKVPGALPAILGALALLAAISGFAWLQTTRLNASETARTAQEETIGTLRQRIKDDSVLIAQRDALISKQNQAVAAIGEVNQANQAAYQARNAKADQAAEKLRQSASDILAATIDTTDELGRCRAAVGLIRDTITKE